MTTPLDTFKSRLGSSTLYYVSVDVVQVALLQQQVWDGNRAANEHRKELEAQTLKVRDPTTEDGTRSP